MVCRNEEITILREFQSRKESLKYLQKLPLEHKINLSKNLILNCIETFGDQQVYINSFCSRLYSLRSARRKIWL